jgi:hypothetical protein
MLKALKVVLYITAALSVGFFSVGRVNADTVQTDQCTAYISGKDTVNIGGTVYNRARFSIQNAGIYDTDTVKITSIEYTNVQMQCPTGFAADETDQHAPLCVNPTRSIVANEYLQPYEVYAGSAPSTEEAQTLGRGASYVGDPYDNWTNGVNLGSSDDQYATWASPGSWAQWANHETTEEYGSFNIPSYAEVTAIDVEVKGYAAGGTGAHNMGIYLSRDRMQTSQSNGAANDLLWLSVPDSATIHTYHTDTNVVQFVSYDWKPSDFDTGDFAVSIYGDGGSGWTFAADYLRVTITYRIPSAGTFAVFLSDGTTDYQCTTYAGHSLSPELIGYDGSTTSGTLLTAPLCVPKVDNCSFADLFCRVSVWGYNTLNYYFCYDPGLASPQVDQLSSLLQTKRPFNYLSALNLDVVNSIASVSGMATPGAIPSFDITWTPKLVTAGVSSDLNPITIDIDSETFDVAAPFVVFFRGLISVLLWVTVIWYVYRSVQKALT